MKITFGKSFNIQERSGEKAEKQEKVLPEKLGKGNDPKQIFTGLDLWDNTPDDLAK